MTTSTATVLAVTPHATPLVLTAFAYFLVVCIYAVLGFMAIMALKRWGAIICAILFCLMSAQIIHWHNLDAARQRHAAQIVERTPEIYTLLDGKFSQFDRNHDGQIDEKEMATFKTKCSCNTGTINFVRTNFAEIASIHQLKNGYMLTINRLDLENLKERALEQLQ